MIAMRVWPGVRRVAWVCVAVAAVALLTGCPPSREIRQPLAEAPQAIGSLQKLFPTAVTPTYYEVRFVGSPTWNDERLGYVVRFALGDRWYVAYFNRHGKFETLRPDDEVEARRWGMLP